tara:strand:- start:636 stop:1925 length:1290 start_codon:yes stop_codon:yes gene_type:complete
MQKNLKIKNEPYWWSDAKPDFIDQVEWSSNADVLIVGAGYTGLSAALTLLDSGLKVIIIDKEIAGFGASSRNGGITSGKIKPSIRELKGKFGLDLSKQIVEEGNLARKDLYDFIKKEKIDCDLKINGMFVGATSKKGLENQKKETDFNFRSIGIENKIIEKKDVPDFIESNKYVGGIFDKRIGSIHPAKLVKSMIHLVQKKGGLIFDKTTFKKSERNGKKFYIWTNKGLVKSNHLIIATNAYTDKNIPWLRKKLIPVISEMISTCEIGNNRVNSLMPKLTTFGEALNLFYYFRPSPDGKRILIGGRRVRYNNENPTKKLKSGLLEIFPGLNDIEISNHWYGFVTFPVDQLPKLVMHEGIIYAAGYCGSGTVWSRWFGKKAAEIILNFETKSAFYNIPFRKIPFYNGYPWFVPVAIKYFKMQDWWINSRE